MKSKKKIIALVIAMALLLVCFAGATFAYFTDTEFEKNNVITVGNIEIDLYEHSADYDTNNPEGLDLEQNDKDYRDVYLKETNKYLLPGQIVNKYTYINNTGNNDAYVRFVVSVPAKMNEYLSLTWNTSDYDVSDGVLVGDEVVYYCVGKKALVAGTLSEPGLTNVALEPELTEAAVATFQNVFAAGTRDFNITVAAHAIQTVGFDSADDAFVAFDTGNNVGNEKVDPNA